MKLAHALGDREIGENDLPKVMQTLRKALDEGSRRKLREENIANTKKAISESVTPDKMIIGTINSLQELDHVTNTLVKRLRDWYALFDPELEHAERDHRNFISLIMESRRPGKDSMGGALTDEDQAALFAQGQALLTLYAQRDLLEEYLEKLMQEHTPNIKAVAGALIGAKLLAHAGSLLRLSRMPAGTVQLLGAETALFRHLRNKKSRPPKHGIIFNHETLQKAPRNRRGKVARTLADTISIAARVDYFKGEFVGDTLRKKVEAAK